MTVRFDQAAVQVALLRSWSKFTALQWTADNPALGQSNVTALLVHDMFGGDILKTPLPDGSHFYNRIDGTTVDFTASQFAAPITYDDRPSDRGEAEQGVTLDEYAALKTAFAQHYVVLR